MQGVLALVGRMLIALIFLMSAVGNKIPKFNDVVVYMQQNGVPMPEVLLVGAIVFLIVGSLLVIVGFKTRIGALMLLVFLVLATYWFHDFWTIEDPAARQLQMIQAMKNLSMMGAMVFLISMGPGPLSLDARRAESGEA